VNDETRTPLEIARDGLTDAIDAATDLRDEAVKAVQTAKDEVTQLRALLRALPKDGRVDGLIVSAEELKPRLPAKPKPKRNRKRKGGASGSGNPPGSKRKLSPPDPSIGPCRYEDILDLLSDGQERTTGEIAASLRTSSTRASACLASLVQRDRGIVRRMRPASAAGPGQQVRPASLWSLSTSEMGENAPPPIPSD